MTIKTRLTALEQRAAGVMPSGFSFVMTPEEWADAESKGLTGEGGFGVLVIPAVMGEAEWNEAAAKQQAALCREVAHAKP